MRRKGFVACSTGAVPSEPASVSSPRRRGRHLDDAKEEALSFRLYQFAKMHVVISDTDLCVPVCKEFKMDSNADSVLEPCFIFQRVQINC